MTIIKRGCRHCGGDVHVDYKANRVRGGMHKCLQCGQIWALAHDQERIQ